MSRQRTQRTQRETEHSCQIQNRALLPDTTLRSLCSFAATRSSCSFAATLSLFFCGHAPFFRGSVRPANIGVGYATVVASGCSDRSSRLAAKHRDRVANRKTADPAASTKLITWDNVSPKYCGALSARKNSVENRIAA
jgi:hypothetical protein